MNLLSVITKAFGTAPTPQQIAAIEAELRGMQKVFFYLLGEDTNYHAQAFAALHFIKSNYKEWDKILIWLKRNELYGKKLVEFFQNESPDGGGYHMGVTLILSRIKGNKNFESTIKLDELS